jgi:hypothetical protein
MHQIIEIFAVRAIVIHFEEANISAGANQDTRPDCLRFRRVAHISKPAPS